MFTGAGGVDLSALAALPARARAVVGAGICNLAEELAVATTAQRKQLGTDAARRQHYVQFARGLLELPDAQLRDLRPKVQTYIMLVYLSYLCRGNTLKGMVCREQTIRGYMKVAVDHVFAKTKRDVRVYPEEDVDPSKWKEHPHFRSHAQKSPPVAGYQEPPRRSHQNHGGRVASEALRRCLGQPQSIIG
jgi:hypothetical protein